jgi:hypothetical protein
VGERGDTGRFGRVEERERERERGKIKVKRTEKRWKREEIVDVKKGF